MIPARRQQKDIEAEQKHYSDAAQIDFTHETDLARQEYVKETDVNEILARAGLNPMQGLNMRQPLFGEVDFDIDLQHAKQVIADAQEAFKRLPKELRDIYPTWQALYDAAERGELERVTTDTEEPKNGNAPSSAPRNPEGTGESNTRNP